MIRLSAETRVQGGAPRIWGMEINDRVGWIPAEAGEAAGLSHKTVPSRVDPRLNGGDLKDLPPNEALQWIPV